MPSLRKKGRNWYLAVCRGGVRREIALGPNERLARLRHAEIEAEIERGKAGFAVEHPPTFQELIDRWFAERTAGLSASYLKRARGMAARLLELLDGDRAISERDLRRYQVARMQAGVKTKTVNGEVAFAKQVHGERGMHPFRGVRPLVCRDAKPVRWLTVDEVRRLLAAAIPRAVPYLVGYLYTGARRSELLAVTWRDVDLAAGTLRLPNLKTAGRRPGDSHRTLPLHQEVRRVLMAASAAREPSPWPAPNDSHLVRKWVVTAARRAGLDPIPTLHDLRHTFASHLAQRGVPLHTIGKLLGHTNPTTTAIYAHLSVESTAAAVGLLDFRGDTTP